MKRHRFFVGKTELTHEFWFDDERLIHQWLKVLRFAAGSQVVLFDGEREDRLYEIAEIGNGAVRLRLITELKRQTPKNNLYLFFSLLKKDKNDWVLQKCTEIGAGHFVPIITDRTEKTGFSVERAEKIVIEAAEQCGRSDIPSVREPISLPTAIKEFDGKIDLYFADQSDENPTTSRADSGVFIGPEGGWTEAEKQLLEKHAKRLNLSQFTLRAETACVASTIKLVQ